MHGKKFVALQGNGILCAVRCGTVVVCYNNSVNGLVAAHITMGPASAYGKTQKHCSRTSYKRTKKLARVKSFIS